MNVFIDETAFEMQRIGGISRYFSELLYELARLPDLEIILFVGESSNLYLHRLEGVSSIRIIRSGSVRWFPRLLNACIKSVRRKLVFFRYSWGKAVIYHPSYFEVDPFIQRLAGGVILTVHDLIYETIKSNPRKKKISKRRRLQNLADGILTVSHSTANDLVSFNPQVVSQITVTPLSASFPDLLGHVSLLDLSDPFFLFVGTRKGYKFGDLALTALQQLHSCGQCTTRLLFVGGGAFTDGERTQIQSLGLANFVSQVDLSDQDLMHAYSEAVALLFPSAYEGFGLPVLEAIHHECPK